MGTSHGLLAKSTVLFDLDTAILNDFIFTRQEKGGLFSGLIKKKEAAAEVSGHIITACTHFYYDFIS